MLGAGISFNPKTGYVDMPMQVPCGQCLACRLARSKAWAIRCMHELQSHPISCFITLTYDDENLPKTLSLQKEHAQKFIRALRKKIYPQKISYFLCGEYGDIGARPHYHALIFGYDFADKQLIKKGKDNNANLYRSDTLQAIWKKGFCSIGAVTFESAAYISRYTVKKIYGKPAAEHYGDRIPEFLNMSLKPAIGKRWIQQYSKETFQSDSIVVRGFEQPVPAYYVKDLKRRDQVAHKTLKATRRRDSLTPQALENNSPQRLVAKNAILQAKQNLRKQTL